MIKKHKDEDDFETLHVYTNDLTILLPIPSAMR